MTGVSGQRRDFTLDDRYLTEEGTIYLTGIQALVRMMIDRARFECRCGRTPATFVSGYEGSPLAGYDLEIQRRLRLLTAHGVVFRPGLNEEIAATSLGGTQLAGEVSRLKPLSPGAAPPQGITGVWYGKAAGLDRASDAVRHANLIGTSPNGGVVALVGDDPAMKSSSCPSSSEPMLADLQLPAFYPADSHEVLEYYLHAVEISRASGLWAAMKIVVNVADGASTAVVPAAWSPPDLSDVPAAYTHRPHARLLGPDQWELERTLMHDRQDIALEYVRRSGVNAIHGARTHARIGIVAAGKTWLDLRQALAALGVADEDLGRYGIRLLKLGAVFPVEPTVVREFARGLSEIIVVEDKRGYLETAVRSILYGGLDAPAVYGKYGPVGERLFSAAGELDPDAVARGLARRLPEHGVTEPVQAWRDSRRERNLLPLAPRTPYFCSGCPHNSSTKAPDGSLIGGGIGCHSMVMMLPDEQRGDVTGLCQMGGEGGQWLGIAPFAETPHLIQNLGDGTFAHSGSLAVRAAAAAGVNVTYKILYNATVAMTGGQDAVGAMTLRQLVGILLLEGAKRVVVTTEEPARVRKALRGTRGPVDVRHRDDLLTVQEELARVEGLTVLVHDQQCAAEKRRKRKRGTLPTPAARVLINERVCEGCGDCGQKSNCLSVRPVETEFGRKTQIHQSSCNLDFSCLKGDCPSFLTVVPGTRQAPKPGRGADLPEPVQRFSLDRFAMRITGIGGTGVVTVGQVLATAAFLDGAAVRSLDQTGLAQKGGAVVHDLKLSAEKGERAAKLAEGECDLYLGCDALVASDPVHLRAADPDRTIALISTAEVPTGPMVVNPAVHYPRPEEIRAALAPAVATAHFVDADRLAEELFGDEQFANMLLAGAAYQAGALPVTAESIERAIQLNGVQVETNLAAFRAGRAAVLANDQPGQRTRRAVITPPSQGAVLRVSGRVAAEGELARLTAIRIPELISYQDERYAAGYADFIERARTAEARAVPGSTVLAEAVARGLFHLMAYKDEYEVARLCLDPALDAAVAAQFGAGSRTRIQLHPPVLRVLGMKNKIALGGWARPGLGLLYRMRRLRGTRLDPFGRTPVRRVERELIIEYRNVIERLLTGLDANSLDAAVEVASLPDMVRGYEEIKLRNVTAYRQRLAELTR